jgi:hypothetical protein
MIDDTALMLAWSRAFSDRTNQPNNLHEHDIVTMYRRLRELQPDIYIELGRGDGCSTLVAAMALAANRKGRIVSFDLHEIAGHDLLDRFSRLGRLEIDAAIADIRHLTRDTWAGLCSGCATVAVLVDAHEDTGIPVSAVMLPFMREQTEIRWFAMFHDVLKIDDRVMSDALSDENVKKYPFTSPFPEYRNIFPALSGMNVDHFSNVGKLYRKDMEALGVSVFMPPGRATIRSWRDGTDIAGMCQRYDALAASSMMCVTG